MASNVSFHSSTLMNHPNTNNPAAASDGEPPYVKYPKLVLVAIVMVGTGAAALASSLWRDARTTFGASRPARFTTRDSFARGRGDYAVVDNDEGELLGDESDEEV